MIKIEMHKPRTLAAFICVSLITGCATFPTPRNGSINLYAAQQVGVASDQSGVAPLCHPAAIPSLVATRHYVAPSTMALRGDLLGVGDRVRVNVIGDKDQLTGSYIVSANGELMLGGAVRISAVGLSITELRAKITQALVERQLVRPLPDAVVVAQIELQEVGVNVSGAVFEPGRVMIGERTPETRALHISNIVSGDADHGRTLSAALRAAGGIRPDADPQAIYLVRGQEWTRVDVTGAFDGMLDDDLSVTTGDHIIAQTTGCLQEAYVRPSPVTTPGIRIYISNLSRPAPANALSAISKEATSLPYGTRFLQGIVTSNCAGGSALNAGRTAVLISRNPITGQSIVIARKVEALIRDSDRDARDPYLMPGDAIACYDSRAMNLQDVITTISMAVTPSVLLRGIVR